jgi:inward rectifier potassium channel
MANETVRNPGNLSYSFRVIGAPRPGLRDAYHALLRTSWGTLIAIISATFLLLNAAFAGIYVEVGGVANAQPGSFVDAFFFSVETMATIGYGAMYPASHGANVVMVVESIVGLLITALATGLVFVRFSLTRARIVFAQHATISPMDGVPTLMIRLGNDRSNRIHDARLRLMMTVSSRTAEGVMWYRTTDLALVRDLAPALARSWTLLHRIDESSPLHGHTPESLAKLEAEFLVTVSGTDDTSLQPIHARWTYEHFSVVWGARLADILSESADGNVVLDLRHFHDITPTTPSESFPWPAGDLSFRESDSGS